MKRETNRDRERLSAVSTMAGEKERRRKREETKRWEEVERARDERGGGEGMDERQMNESFHERNSYRIRETPYGVPATRATRRLIGIRPWQPKQGFL